MRVKEVNISEYKLLSRGKVRDIYDLGDTLLLISTDRISAFDHVLPELIPYKGFVLNQISRYWFEKTRNIIDNHYITDVPSTIYKNLEKYADLMTGRSMVVRKAEVIPFECIVRGYITGSAWSEYKKHGTVNGERIDYELRESDQFKAPLFTPSTKEKSGHDINVSFDYIKKELGDELAELIKRKSICLYKYGYEYAMKRGIIIADTKFEFGMIDGKLTLIDEVLTPDSSRFWPLNEYVPGKKMVGLDKQFVRNYLLEIDWDKNSEPPHLPDNIVEKASEIYRSIYNMLTGKEI
ncbi:MAG: phosphoribosylaminoimidazolesuccinocarboxamide synthase [Proteobacteria bacterium]|nr:phosphoribosylaminoimidazolesuccinocarboxamide synthase [Pseudomonadota bacterium]